ncbi:hypothetical protein DBV15_07821 [Temnothorax longispinosus]|uniref:Uncharacterized protein n=1 Tax=Temnothorax longispinosus TaxID=300112 RepID=A0A4S2K018_9HYME|nr:hypothetical protein DBV15_07821 [Temnothorax longispinosus]
MRIIGLYRAFFHAEIANSVTNNCPQHVARVGKEFARRVPRVFREPVDFKISTGRADVMREDNRASSRSLSILFHGSHARVRLNALSSAMARLRLFYLSSDVFFGCRASWLSVLRFAFCTTESATDQSLDPERRNVSLSRERDAIV